MKGSTTVATISTLFVLCLLAIILYRYTNIEIQYDRLVADHSVLQQKYDSIKAALDSCNDNMTYYMQESVKP
jgi:hypothetical protein